MISNLNPRVRMGIVMVISLLISGFFMNYAIDTSEDAPPIIKLDTIASDFIRSISESQSYIMTSIQSIHIPTLISFTPPTAPVSNPQNTVSGVPAPTIVFEKPPIMSLSSPPPTVSVSNPPNPQPTTATSPTIPSAFPTSQIPSTIPPTKTPKPTKVPKPTAVPLLKLESTRPGKGFEEAISILSPIICVPKAMLWATLQNEYGAWIGQVEADWTNRNTLQGSDTTAIQGSQAIVGVTQMMSDTWWRVKPYVMKKFEVSDMSLNVTFDSLAAGGYHLRNVGLAGQAKEPCDDWDVKYILYAACRYNGACPPNTMGQTNYYNDYTYKVCEAYNRYSETKKNCK